MTASHMGSPAAGQGGYVREITFAIKLYALSALVGVVISFASAYLGHSLVTFPEQSIVLPPTVLPAADPPPDLLNPVGDPPGIQIAPVASDDPRIKFEIEKMQSFFRVYTAQPVMLAERPQIGDTVPSWVQIKPLPADVQPMLTHTGFVPPDKEASAVFRYDAAQPNPKMTYHYDFVIVDHMRKVVGVVPGK
jgi:hypothetical protein